MTTHWSNEHPATATLQALLSEIVVSAGRAHAALRNGNPHLAYLSFHLTKARELAELACNVYGAVNIENAHAELAFETIARKSEVMP